MSEGAARSVVEGLARAIDELELPAHGETIAQARHLADLLQARIAEAEAEWNARGCPEVEGFSNLVAFERHRCGLTLTDARRAERRARRLTAWPLLARAWRAGCITGTQVELVCAVVPDRHVERLGTDVAGLVDEIEPLSALATKQALERRVAVADAHAEREAVEEGREPPVTPPPDRELSASRSIDDALFVQGHVDRDGAAYVEKALAAAARPDGPGERRSPKERRADALVDICRAYLESLENPDGKRSTERLTICADIVTLYRAWLRGAGVRTADELEDFFEDHPDLGALDRGLFLDAFDHTTGTARTLDGSPVTDALVAAVAAAGAMELLLSAEGRILHLGRTVRLFSQAQRRAILARDQGCRSPGCAAPVERCDVHHVTPWEAGGRTDITNGVAKCRRCHLDHHRRGIRDHLDADGTYTLVAPDGTRRVTRPPGWSEPRACLPLATTSRAAPEAVHGAPVFGRRCGCSCSAHPDPVERAEMEEARRLVLERIRQLQLERGA